MTMHDGVFWLNARFYHWLFNTLMSSDFGSFDASCIVMAFCQTFFLSFFFFFFLFMTHHRHFSASRQIFNLADTYTRALGNYHLDTRSAIYT